MPKKTRYITHQDSKTLPRKVMNRYRRQAIELIGVEPTFDIKRELRKKNIWCCNVEGKLCVQIEDYFRIITKEEKRPQRKKRLAIQEVF